MAFKSLRAAFAALSLATYAAALVSPAGHTVVVNGITYYAAPEAVSIISATADQLKTAATTGVDLIPLTVMEDKTSSFTTAVFRSLAGNYTASDDVFNIGFLQGKIISSKLELCLITFSCLPQAQWHRASDSQIPTRSCSYRVRNQTFHVFARIPNISRGSRVCHYWMENRAPCWTLLHVNLDWRGVQSVPTIQRRTRCLHGGIEAKC